jgi:hypothetical protein
VSIEESEKEVPLARRLDLEVEGHGELIRQSTPDTVRVQLERTAELFDGLARLPDDLRSGVGYWREKLSELVRRW